MHALGRPRFAAGHAAASLAPSGSPAARRAPQLPSPEQETLPDWQVAVLLGGSAVAGLASTVAALAGISALL